MGAEVYGVQQRGKHRSRSRQEAAPPGRHWVRAVGWGIVGACALFALVVAAIPAPASGAAAPSVLYGSNDQLVATLGQGQRLPVSLSQIPAALQEATIATEDASFYRNFGINIVAIARAALVDLRARAIIEGGSTITQQLAKNLYLTQRRTIGRKLLEVLFTMRLEATHSKTQILTMYLNTIYYGEAAWGIGAAAEAYFGEPVSALDLAQCALLAGLPAAPVAYDPFQHPAAARARQMIVLQRMVKVGDITSAEAQRAAGQTLHFKHGAAVSGPGVGYFVQYVLSQIAQAHPALEREVEAGGYRIYTTMNPVLQADADTAFSQNIPTGIPDASGILQPQGALVAIDPTNGAVRALIGGRNATTDPFNRAVYAVRQPGSTFKAFLYATVIADGHPVTARQFDGPVSYPNPGGARYVPHDDNGYTYRNLTIREAAAISDNVVAVKWANIVGPGNVITTARKMGITSPLQPTLPLVLGAYGVTPLQLADAYVPLANLGYAVAPWAVRSVVDSAGATVWRPTPPPMRRVLDPGVAYLVTSLFQSVMVDGTGKNLLPIVGEPVAGKTGSTNNLEDAWFVGYTPQLVTAVWVGDDIPAPLGGYGSTLAGPIWAHFMASALAGTQRTGWTMPADVMVKTVSAIDGLLPNATSPTVQEAFLRGTAPTKRTTIIGTGGRTAGITGLPGSTITPAADSRSRPLAPTAPAIPSSSTSENVPVPGGDVIILGRR